MGTITKALDLLTHFSTERPEIGLSDFVRLTNRDKATLHRHLSELALNGYLEQPAGVGRYRLGPALARLAQLRDQTFSPLDAVAPIVQALAAETNELVHVALLRDGTLTPLCHADTGAFGVRVTFDETETLPLHATASGLATLAFGPPDILQRLNGRQIARYTQHTETDLDRLSALIDITRGQGYSFSDAFFEYDVLAIAAPIFGTDALAIGAVAITYPRARALIHPAAPRLIRAATDITHALGGAVPDTIERLWRSAA